MRYFQSVVGGILLLCVFLSVSCGFLLLPPLEVVSVAFLNDVEVVFSAKPVPATVRSAFSLTEDKSTINGVFEFNDKIVRFIPENGIRIHKNYELIITTAAEDERGNSMQQNFKKAHSTRSDLIPPEIISISPADEEECETQPSVIDFLFSKPVDIPSFYSALQISPKFDYLCEFNASGDGVKLIPATPLVLGTRYTITLSTMLSDINKNTLVQKFTSTFLYGLDRQSPKYTFAWKNAADETLLAVNAQTDKIPVNAQFIIKFDERVGIDSIGKYVSVFPVAGFETTPDRETGVSATLVFSPLPVWGSRHEITVKKGLADLSGNMVPEDRVFTAIFDHEPSRPVSLVKGYFKNGSIFTPITQRKQYETLMLNVLDFPTTVGANETPSELYLFFQISDDANGVATVSVMDAVGISDTNNCVDFTIKTLYVLTNAEYVASGVYGTASTDPDLNKEGQKITVVKIGLEVANTDNLGTVTFSVGKGVRDTLGNTMADDFYCIMNKQ